jgi:hypothetical protein
MFSGLAGAQAFSVPPELLQKVHANPGHAVQAGKLEEDIDLPLLFPPVTKDGMSFKKKQMPNGLSVAPIVLLCFFLAKTG